jgi:hypothetical protein
VTADAEHHFHFHMPQDPYQAARLDAIDKKMEEIMSALTDLQAADAALKAEVATFLADVSAALANSGSSDDPAIEAVVADINNEVAQLQAADPANAAPAAPVEPAPDAAPAQ